MGNIKAKAGRRGTQEGAPAPVEARGSFTARRPARTQAVEGPPTFGQGGRTGLPARRPDLCGPAAQGGPVDHERKDRPKDRPDKPGG